MPLLPFWAIADAFRRLPRDELEFALRHKILPIVSIPGLTLYASFGAASRGVARRMGLKLVAEAGPADFIEAARQMLGRRLRAEATHGLAARLPEFSASRRLTRGQAACALGAAAVCAVAVYVLSLHLLWVLASLFGGLFFPALCIKRTKFSLPEKDMVPADACTPGPQRSAMQWG